MAPFSRSSSRSSEIGRSVAILAVAVGGAIGNARAQCLDARLGPWFGFFNGDFGTSVALDGSVVAVGEPEGFTSSTGTVFMFRFDGTEWNEEARIQPSDSEVRSFGASIGVEGDVAAIGAPLHTQSAGAVFIHRYDGVAWVREASLVGSDVSHGDRFGSAVAISGNRVIGGASSYGAAYVFEHDGAAWSEVVKLTPPIGSFVSYFGTSVDLEDSLAVIGAPGGSANPAGAAFVYRREGGAWVWEATLTSAPEEFDRFGAAVALHGSRIVVGAPGDDEAGAQAGAVYVFEKIGSDWTEIDKLVPPSSVEGEFGTSVTVWGDRIVGGAPDHATGTAYLFTLDQGQWVGTEIANPEPYFGYGVAVAIQDDCLMITSEHNASDDEGAVFGYRLDANGRDCNTNGMCDGEEILADPTLDCNGNIIPDACEDLGGDCNTNGVPDACDIADDTSLDCDANGVPDECDLAFGAPDLNANGIPDTCDGRFEDQVIGQPGTLADDRLGFAVALSGSLMVAGAPATNSNAGAAYLFEHDGAAWVPLQELVPDENSMGDQFGFAVGIGTDTIFVAAPFDDDLGSSSGSVFAFRFDGQSWIQDQQIFAADETTFDRFGFSLAARGDQLIVGAIGESDLGSFSGAAYAFAQVDAQWVQTTKLVAGDGAAHEQFGSAVDTDGDVLIIGAWQDDDGGFWAGSAYIYRWSGTSWDFETKLLAGDTDEEDKFGAAVSISGNRAIVGAPETRGFAIGPGGIAYLFEYDGSTWRETGRLMDESYVGGRLGASVAIEGDIAIVGVPDGVLDGVGLPGLAYIYRHCGDGWTRKAAFAGVGTPDAGQFGWSVAIDQERAVIGAEHGTGAGPATGSLHVFDDLASPGADCNENGICDECDVINGTSTDCNGNLVPDECDILEGIVEDCNGNGRGDECEFAYQLDDGWWEYIINPVDVLQINQFTVREGEETIHGIRVFWRGKFTLSMPVTLALYDDPNNDGNPEDAVVLRTVAATSVALGGFYTVPIEPTVVGAAGDSFFVGALSSLVRVAADGTAPTSGRSWADLGSLGTLQIDDLSGVVAITDITCGGRCQFDFMIGAVAGPPVICSCSADLNGDGDVGFADMLRIITAWGPCGAPCPEDLNGNGSVDFADILVVIGAWGSCS